VFLEMSLEAYKRIRDFPLGFKMYYSVALPLIHGKKVQCNFLCDKIKFEVFHVFYVLWIPQFFSFEKVWSSSLDTCTYENQI